MIVVITDRPQDYPNRTTFTYQRFMSMPVSQYKKFLGIHIDPRISEKQASEIATVVKVHDLPIVSLLPRPSGDSRLIRMVPDQEYVIRLPLSGEVIDLKALTPADLARLGVGNIDELRASVERLTKDLVDINPYSEITKRLKIYRENKRGEDLARLARSIFDKIEKSKKTTVTHFFRTRKELADHLVKQLPSGVPVRKQNALRFKICVEMQEDDVLDLASNSEAQIALVTKYQPRR